MTGTCACNEDHGKVTAYWFDDKGITNDPMRMTAALAEGVGLNKEGFAALLNKQYTVTPSNINGMDGYLVSLTK